VLFLNEVPQAVLDRPRSGLNVESVLDSLPGDAQHFCRTPCKYVLVTSKEVDELTFLFGIQAGLNLKSLVRVFGIDLHGLGILGHFEGAR
jgi:hypothetical protein